MLLKYNIIPKPNSYVAKEGTYCVSSKTEVLCSEEFVSCGNYLTSYLKTKPEPNEGTIKIKKVPEMESEAYKLTVSQDGIVISASTFGGAFYGAVTLKMVLMQAEKHDGKAVINNLIINDKPEYPFRGLMLDSSRHYFDVQTIKDLLENMAFLKLNKFHWHLSDDQGYRIESKVYPLLNEIGSKRKCSHLEGCGLKNDTNGEYFHYYTQEEIKDIVTFAKSLNIDVIPEIDIPGHTMALLAAYPELGCEGKEFEVKITNGVMTSILCAGDENVFDFLDKLLEEICSLFPYSEFHIGGDEAFEGHKIWAKCEKCIKTKTEKNLKTEKDLQIYFMQRVVDILKKYGKTTIAWDDCIGDSLDTSVACQYWQTKSMRTVRRQAVKRDIIVSPTPYFYFDVTYAALPLKKAYKYNNAKVGLNNPSYRIKGVECELWTEWIDDRDSLEFSVYPRTVAFAEVAWTQLKNRNYKDFYTRLDWFKTYMNKKNINYSRVEKRRLDVKQKCYYHLGSDGKEYKKSMELK